MKDFSIFLKNSVCQSDNGHISSFLEESFEEWHLEFVKNLETNSLSENNSFLIT